VNLRSALAFLVLGMAAAGCSTDYVVEVDAPTDACWTVTTTEGAKHGFKSDCGKKFIDLSDDVHPLSIYF